MKPLFLSLAGLALMLTNALVQAQQVVAPPPSEAELEAPYVHVVDEKEDRGPGDAEVILPAPPPPPPAQAVVPVQKAFGDSFTSDGRDSDLNIPEAKPKFGGVCQPQAVEFDPCPNAWFNKLPAAVVAERDRLYALAALAVVNEDWQFAPDDAKAMTTPEAPGLPPVANLPRRGHNIGGVLVDDTGNLVWWERNSNGIECSGTNHGETRMMISYLKFSRRSTLGCHSIYTSLEPCAMCSGMMTQQKIARTIYVQKDHGFGAALERLHQGYAPRNFACGFPRAPFSRYAADLGVKAAKDLDSAFHRFLNATNSDDLTSFLQTKPAHDIYEAAEAELLAFKPMEENKAVFASIRNLIAELRTPMYKRANVSVDQHVQIERGRRKQVANFNLPRAGLALEIDECCRPAMMANTSLRFNPNFPQAPLTPSPLGPGCRAESPVFTKVPALPQ